MKKNLIFIWALFFFLGCNDNSYDYGLDRYYVEIVTAVKNNVFQLDNGETLFNVREINSSIVSGERFLINYTLLDQKTNGYDHVVRINGISSVSSGSPQIFLEEDIQVLKDEPIRLESIWLGSHFINIQFYMNFQSIAHTIGLVVGENSLGNEPLEIYFKHDSNNDPKGFPVHLYASFNLQELLGEPQKNKQIRIFVNSSNYGEKAYNFVY